MLKIRFGKNIWHRQPEVMSWGAYAILSLGFSVTILGSAASTMPGYGADSTMHLWFLEWFPHALMHGLNPWVTNLPAYPYTANLLWNNADWLLAWVSWPFITWVGGVKFMDAIYILAPILAAGLMAQVLRHHFSAKSAWLGGAWFGFAPFVLSEMAAGHLAWILSASLPLGWLWGRRWVLAVTKGNRSWGWGLGLGFWVVLQYWVSKELLTTTMLLAVLVGIIYGRRVGHWVNQHRQAVGSSLGLGLGVALLFLGYPVWMQLSFPHGLRSTMYISPQLTSMDLLAWFIPGYSQALTTPALLAIAKHFTGTFLEVDGYVGIPLLGVVIAVIINGWRLPTVRWGLVLVGLGGVFSLGSHLHVAGHILPIPLPWDLFAHLPILNKVIPSRMFLFAIIGIAVLLAWGFDNLRLGRRVQVALVVLMAATIFPSYGILQGEVGSPLTVPQVINSPLIRDLQPSQVLVTIPISTVNDHALEMYWQILRGFNFKAPFGVVQVLHHGVFTNPAPDSALGRYLFDLTVHTTPRGFNNQQLRQELGNWHVHLLVLVPQTGYQNSLRDLESWLGTPTRVVQGAAVWINPR